MRYGLLQRPSSHESFREALKSKQTKKQFDIHAAVTAKVVHCCFFKTCSKGADEEGR